MSYNDYIHGWYIGKNVEKIKRIKHQIKTNKASGNVDKNEELRNIVEKSIAVMIYRVHRSLTNADENKKYRFEQQSYTAIRSALDKLCYESKGQDIQCLEAFLEAIKIAKTEPLSA